jgi:trimeric autotransporter adhesin
MVARGASCGMATQQAVAAQVDEATPPDVKRREPESQTPVAKHGACHLERILLTEDLRNPLERENGRRTLAFSCISLSRARLFASGADMRNHLKRSVRGVLTGYIKRLALFASIGAAACAAAETSFAQAVTYVKACNVMGVGFFYIPGTDKCAYGQNMPYSYATAYGNYSTQPGVQSTAYGTNAFANGNGSVAIGDHAFSGGDPFSASPGASGEGIDGQVPNSAFSNANTTAVGQGAQAGATAAGEDNATAIGNGALANAANASALGQGAQANATNSVALGFGSVANVANTVSVGAVGAERRIVNMANGTIGSGSTDAVNGGQLYTANQRVAAAFGGGAGLDSNGQLTAPSYTIAGITYHDVGSALGAVNGQLGTGSSQYFKANSVGPAANASGTDAIAVGSNAQATQSGSIAVGLNSASTGTNAIAIGTGSVATGSVAVGAGASASNGGAAYGDGAVATGVNAAALGTNASATAANSVSIGSGSTNTAANTVSFGSAGNERRLTNLAAGINQTDAVNVAQLQSTATGLQGQISDNQVEARRGVAAAMAMTPASMPSAAGRTSWAMNTSTFHGEYAFGGGLAHRLDTNVPMALTAGYAYGGGNNHGARVGLAGEF